MNHIDAQGRAAVVARRHLLQPVAERIRWVRRSRSLACGTVAREAGIRPVALRRVENGEQGLSAAAVGRIARALGVDEEELYPGGRPDAFWVRLGAELRDLTQAPALPFTTAGFAIAA